MIVGLERFVTRLRRNGLGASPAEWLDALRAVESVGLENRERFRVALRCALAKRASELALFDRLFDGFFVSPIRRGRARERSRGDAGAPDGPGRNAADATGLRPPGRRDRRGGRVDWRPALPSSGQASGLEARLGLRCRETDKPRLVAGRRPVVVVDRPVRAKRAGAVLPLVRRGLRESLTVDEEREIAARIPRLVERIRLRTGRRWRRASRGALYLRRVFRESLGTGGVPCALPRRRALPRRTRVVLLIDVSWSTARAAGLFLMLAGEFLRRAADTRVLVFVDRVRDATAEIERWLGRSGLAQRSASREQPRPRPGSGIVRHGLSFAGLLGSLPGLDLDAPSDYGRAFDRLARSRFRPTGRRTILLVLGDGRTNRFDPQGWAFEAIAERCGSVIWLVPESVDEWGTGDSALASYLPHTDVAVGARDLAGLGQGVVELLRRL